MWSSSLSKIQKLTRLNKPQPKCFFFQNWIKDTALYKANKGHSWQGAYVGWLMV